MGIFNLFPFTNFSEFNLDWIIRQIKELRDKIDELEPGSAESKFTFLSKLGADPDGRTDCTEKLNEYFSSIDPTEPELLIVDGNYYIAGNVGATPRNVSVLFLDGSFTIGPEAVVYWKSEIMNTDGQIFKGSVTGLQIYGITIRPEWFGAKCDGQTESGPAINAAIQCARHCDVVLKAGTKSRSASGTWTPTANCYLISIPVLVNREYVALRGEEPSAVICSRTLTNMIQIGSGLTLSRIERCRLENLELILCHDNILSNSPDAAASYTIDVIGLESGILFNVRCLGNPNGYYITQTSGVKFEKCACHTAPAYGALIPESRMFYINGRFRNTSNTFKDCGGSNGTNLVNQTGLYIDGNSSVRDAFFRHLEFGEVGNGVIITADQGASGNNILFDNLVLDRISDHCIRINGSLVRQSIRFINSYFWRYAGDEPTILIAPGPYSVISFENCEFNDDLKNIDTVEIDSGICSFRGCRFRNCGQSIWNKSGMLIATDSEFVDSVDTVIGYFILSESVTSYGHITGCTFVNQSTNSSITNAAIYITNGNLDQAFNHFIGSIETPSSIGHSSIVINRQSNNKINNLNG